MTDFENHYITQTSDNLYSAALIGGVRCPNLTAMTGLSAEEGNGSVGAIQFQVRKKSDWKYSFNKWFRRRTVEQHIYSIWN